MDKNFNPEDLRIQYSDIPGIFQSYIKEEPFQNCIACEKFLLNQGTNYMIEKAIKNNSVEFEYAMCFDCIEQMRESMSEESLQRSQEFIMGKVDIIERTKKCTESGNSGYEQWISNCMITGKPVHQLDEYILYAHCDGSKMVQSVFPYMISVEIQEEVQELMSAKTKDEIDRFMDDHFGLPPEWKEILKKDIVLI